eukprot:TRINITY_DN104444_c0_g1_i1.p2 TRINITY_DN104444_c0_g1~~TRINITY_DN104444_c0_g1_i1.p2  ORF type:complete len:140 (-),score=48.08 TRINITY_DN104444_c0_g1_i1:172-591(-)
MDVVEVVESDDEKCGEEKQESVAIDQEKLAEVLRRCALVPAMPQDEVGPGSSADNAAWVPGSVEECQRLCAHLLERTELEGELQRLLQEGQQLRSSQSTTQAEVQQLEKTLQANRLLMDVRERLHTALTELRSGDVRMS